MLTRVALTLLLSALVPSVYAEGPKTSFLRCAFKADTGEKVQWTYTARKTVRDVRFHEFAKSLGHVEYRAPASNQVTAKAVGRLQKPPALSLTLFECKW